VELLYKFGCFTNKLINFVLLEKDKVFSWHTGSLRCLNDSIVNIVLKVQSYNISWKNGKLDCLNDSIINIVLIETSVLVESLLSWIV
jgi:hypothetical protein